MKKLFVLAVAGIFSLNCLVAQTSTPAVPQASPDKKEVKKENKTEKKVSNHKGKKIDNGGNSKGKTSGKDPKVEKKAATDNGTEKK